MIELLELKPVFKNLDLAKSETLRGQINSASIPTLGQCAQQISEFLEQKWIFPTFLKKTQSQVSKKCFFR